MSLQSNGVRNACESATLKLFTMDNEAYREVPATPISKARTPEEIGEFWDSHSLADYWDETYEVEFEVRAKRRRRITLDPEVYAELEAAARARGVLPETLVNLWLAERLHGQTAVKTD